MDATTHDTKPRGFLRRLLALCRKESLQIIRDPSSVLIAFVLPVVMLVIFGYGINLDAARIRVGLVLEDDGEEAQRFAGEFIGTPYIEPVFGTRREMEARITGGTVRGFVVIPQDFSEKLDREGAVAPVQVVTDGSEPSIATFVEGYTRGVWQGWKQQRALARGEALPPRVTIEPRFWYNPAARSRNYLIPGSITVIMTVVGALLTSLVVAREWERGTMEALLSTPVNRSELLLSKLLPYYVLGILSLLVSVMFAVLVLGVPFRGSIPLLLAVGTFFLFSALGLGLMLSTVTRNQFNAAQGGLNAAFLPAVMLSGFIFEISSMPPPVRAVTYLIPARYFVTAIQTLFQVGDVMAVIWRSLLFLALASIFFLGITAKKTRRRLD